MRQCSIKKLFLQISITLICFFTLLNLVSLPLIESPIHVYPSINVSQLIGSQSIHFDIPKIKKLNINNNNPHFVIVENDAIFLTNYSENVNESILKIPLIHKVYTNNAAVESLSQLTQTALESMVYEQTLTLNNANLDSDWGQTYQPNRLWCSVPTAWPEKKDSIEVSFT